MFFFFLRTRKCEVARKVRTIERYKTSIGGFQDIHRVSCICFITFGSRIRSYRCKAFSLRYGVYRVILFHTRVE